MAENNEIQELIKKAVTSKSLEVITEAEAKKLVESQTCRPGMISFYSFTFTSIKNFQNFFNSMVKFSNVLKSNK